MPIESGIKSCEICRNTINSGVSISTNTTPNARLLTAHTALLLSLQTEMASSSTATSRHQRGTPNPFFVTSSGTFRSILGHADSRELKLGITHPNLQSRRQPRTAWTWQRRPPSSSSGGGSKSRRRRPRRPRSPLLRRLALRHHRQGDRASPSSTAGCACVGVCGGGRG